MQNPSPLSKFSVMIGSCSFNIFLGGMYAWGSINPYVSSFFKNAGVSNYESTVIVYPLWLLFQTLGALFSLPLGSKFGFRLWALIALTLFCVNVFTSSFSLKLGTPYPFIFQFGILNGFLVGTTYFLPLYSPWTYYPNKKGFVTGTTLFFAGFAAVIMDNLCQFLINPQSLPSSGGIFPDDVTNNVQFGIQALSYFFLGVTVFGSIFFREPWVSTTPTIEDETEGQIDQNLVQTEPDLVKTGNPTTNPSNDIENIDKILGEAVTDIGKNQDITPIEGGNENLLMHIEKAAVGASEFHVQHSRNIQHSKNIFLGGGSKSQYYGSKKQTQAIVRNNTDTVNLVALGSNKLVENLVKREMDENPDAFRESLLEKEDIFADEEEEECPSISVALKSRQFIQMFLMGMTGAAYDYFLSSVFKDYGITVPSLNHDRYLTFVGSAGALGNAFSRLAMGLLLDYVEFKWIYGAFLIVQIASGLCIIYIGHNQICYAILIFLGFAGIGAHVSSFPNTTLKVFGNKVGARVYSIVYFSFAFANIGEYTIVQIVKAISARNESFSNGNVGGAPSSNYNIVFYVLTGSSILAFINLIFFNFRPKWERQS